jgi:FkbM family methyltransferase
MKKIIYDFGASDGRNIPYYLLKSDLVIAVEANPKSCEIIKKNFSEEINEKKLIIENCIVSDQNSRNSEFFVHKTNALLSQFPRPNSDLIDNFSKINLESIDVVCLIQKYGEPYYIKIDIEEYDDVILKKIFDNDILPNYISAEAINSEVINLFLNNKNYNSFKLIEGDTIGFLYRNSKIIVNNEKFKYSFHKDSAGPFGNDLYGNWIKKNNFEKLMKFKMHGWRDIHASLKDEFEKTSNFDKYLKIEEKLNKRAKFIKRFLRLKSKLNFF